MLSQIFEKIFFFLPKYSMISCLMNLSITFVKIWVFENVLALMCIQKLFIIIKMMYSGIKLMVLYIVLCKVVLW